MNRWMTQVSGIVVTLVMAAALAAGLYAGHERIEDVSLVGCTKEQAQVAENTAVQVAADLCIEEVQALQPPDSGLIMLACKEVSGAVENAIGEPLDGGAPPPSAAPAPPPVHRVIVARAYWQSVLAQAAARDAGS